MIYILKYGSSVLKDQNAFEKISDLILQHPKDKYIIVNSAFPSKTDAYAKLIEHPELKDALLVLGELESGVLLTNYLISHEIKAQFLNAYQIPIITTNEYGNADIVYLGIDKITNALKNSDVLVIPGFQGIDKEFKWTTLGRGGSDYTALYLAAAFVKKGYKVKCHLFKDKEYIYDALKKPLKKVTYSALETLIKDNAPIAKKALIYAKQNKIPFSIGVSLTRNTKVS